ncbi:MAG: sulfurtransferase [Anoxybacillus sp.]|nr:sulfurtransferase [Anoxybacillus sp.]
MELLIALIVSLIIYELYIRYVPVCGVSMISKTQLTDIQHVAVVDLREYNEATTLPVPAAISLPLSYVTRNYHQIPYKDVILITSDAITTNLGVRKLKRYGFRVKGVCCLEVTPTIKTA